MEMKCPKCGQENRPDAAFCMSCGTPLPDAPFAQLERRTRPAGEERVPGAGMPRAVGAGFEAGTVPPSGGAGTPEVPPRVAGAEDRTVPMPAVPRAENGKTAEGAAAAPVREGGPGTGGGSGRAAPPAGAQLPETPAPSPAPVPPSAPESQAPPFRQAATPLPESQAPSPAPGMRPPQPPPAPVPGAGAFRDAHGVEAGVTSGGEAVPGRTPLLEETIPPQPPRGPGEPPVSPPPPRERPDYYLPPEADYVIAGETRGVAPLPEPVPRETEAPARETPAMDSERTQVVPGAVPPPPPPRTVRRATVTCPECYAPNPEGNSFCQECGSPLSPVRARTPVSGRAAPREGRQQTALLTPGAMAEVEPGDARAARGDRAARGEKSFGVTDVLALLAVGVAGAALALSSFLESFSWKKGVDIGMFTHQGAFTQGRPDLLGGPGMLPYQGTEFLTVGLVVALGIALALVFLAVRVGRGPMFILAGCLLLLPLAYLLFQAVLPLRQTGVEIQPSPGIGSLFSGGADVPGMGPPLWMVSAAGALLIVAGFMAPPRGWGRLLTFLAFFPATVGLAFLCAACYNWNLFITVAGMAGAHAGRAGPGLAAPAVMAGVLPLLP